MPKKQHGLGRGLEALLPQEELQLSGSAMIPVGEIDPNPDQPRRSFSPESITQLAQSVRDQGVLQPILVAPTEGGRYRIIAGERRWRAAREAGLAEVPAIVRDLDTVQQMEIALIENLQREDLNAIEAAQGIRSLMNQCGYTQETVSKRLGKSRPAVANLLRLLTLPGEVQEMVTDGRLSAGHARVLAGMEDRNRQIALARETLEHGWSVRELETLAAGRRQEHRKPDPSKKQLSVELNELQERIRVTLGMKATLTGSEKKGRIVLQYTSREELENLYEAIARLTDEA